jgi:site-specific recombinase XerD
MTPSRPPHHEIAAILEARIQALTTLHRYFRAAAHRFLSYLQTDFPQLRQLSELRRDPHLLGWLRCLSQEDPPLSNSTRRIYLVGLRRLFRDLATQNPSLQPGLILPEDFPPPPPLPRELRLTPRTDHHHQRSPLPHPIFGEIFDAHIQTLTTTLRPSTINGYRVAVRGFLSGLQRDFPQVHQLSELRRDPHLLGWLGRLCAPDPAWSIGTREKYLYNLRRLLHDLAVGHPLQYALILPQDFPRWLPPQLRHTSKRLLHPLFTEIFDAPIQTLATTLRPGTIQNYRCAVHHFLAYLQTDFPQLRQLSELRRDPHLCGWFRRLCEQDPPLSNTTRQHYLLNLRRLLDELAYAGHPLQPGLILAEDLPPRPRYLPRALCPEDDRQLQQELRHIDDLSSNALLLTRATGIRIGECIHLPLDCLRSLGKDQWAMHVPLGKLYTERLVPVDGDVRQMVSRILALRAEAPAAHLVKSAGFLLPRSAGSKALYEHLNLVLHRAAERAGCSHPITCHQLRHTYATEMIRLGVSLPALMQLLGHKDIRMTMRYVQVTQGDLQREFHLAQQNARQHHQIPQLSVSSSWSAKLDLPGIRRLLAATRHLLEMYRRQLQDEKARRKLQRLDKRLLKVAFELDRFGTPQK